MLWKRHLSIYSHGGSKDLKDSKKDNFIKQAGSLAPLQTPPIIYETLESGNPKFLIRRKSKSTKPQKQSMAKTFFLHKGNNSPLIKQILEFHGYVEVFNKESSSFIWYQSPEMVRRDSLRKELNGILTNYFLNHFEITDKQKLYENIVKFHPESVGSFIPKTFIVDFKEGLLKVENGLSEFLVDYFRKNKITKNSKKANSFSFSNYYGQVCITFVKIFRLLNDSKKKQENCQSNKEELMIEPMWIVKPTSLNRGKGIQVVTNLKQLEKIFSEDAHQISIRMYQPEQKTTLTSYVIQEYIPNPLLYQGYKFDLRMWMLIQKNRKSVHVYLYEEGYARIAAHKYVAAKKIKKQKREVDQQGEERENYGQRLQKSIEIYRNKSPIMKSKKAKMDGNDRYIHLTNNAVQKNCKNYGILHEGNQISLKDLLQNLKIDTLNESFLHAQFSKIIKVLFEASKQKLLSKTIEGTYQLFGLDFLLDTNLKVWLLEVNCNPSLEESSQFLKEMLRKMLGDMVEVVRSKGKEEKQQNMWMKVI